MSDFLDSYVTPRLVEVEKEFLAAAKLHSLLEQWFGEPRPDVNLRERHIDDVFFRDGWCMDIVDLSSPSGIQNRYDDELECPISINFWPEEDNSVSQERFYSDGAKLQILVGKNGVLNETEEEWLNSSQIDALITDLSGLAAEPQALDQ